MKIEPISNTSQSKPANLTYDDIKKYEGIYSPVGHSNVRIIVIEHEFNRGDFAILFFNGKDTLQPIAQRSWNGSEFIRMENECVVFGTRSKS